jgi:hypothetical protein
MTDVPPPPPPPPPSFGAPPPGGGAPDVGTALSYGWKKFQANVGPLLIAILISAGAQILLSLIGQFAIRSFVAVVLFELIGVVVAAVAGIGIYRVALQITAGEPADIGKAFNTTAGASGSCSRSCSG